MTPPQNQNIMIHTEEDIKAKFEELGMLALLSQTCTLRNIRRNTKALANRKYTAERGVTFIKKNDGNSQAIMYYWRTLDGGEDYRIEQFTAPDGTFHTTVDTITHPSKINA